MTKRTLGDYLFIWFPVIAVCSAIFYVSSFKTATVSTVYWQEFSIKKFAHVIEYGLLAALTYRALRLHGISSRRAGIYAIIFVFIFGCTDEFHERFVVGRQSRFRDVLIDTFGGTVTIYGIWNLLPRAPKRLKILAKNLQLL